MRWLGVDSGAARVGLAISDAEERLAVPLEVIPAAAAFPAIRSIAAREGVGGVVIGLALTPRGHEEDSARRARALGARIERSLALPVAYEDERLTSVEAERLDAAAGRRGRGEPSDDLAATLILQQFLDRRRDERARSEPADASA